MPIRIVGEKVNELQTTGDLWVEVQLSEETTAQVKNREMMAPIHYRNVVNQPFRNAVIVQEGSYIQFKVKSRGEFGFGYRILGGLRLDARNKVMNGEAQPDVIVDRQYCLPPVSKENIFDLVESDLYVAVHRYDGAAKPMIAVQGFRKIGLSTDDRHKMVTMMNCTVMSWGVYGFIDDATDLDYGLPADIGRIEWGPGIAGPGVANPSVRQGSSSREITGVRQIREDNPDAAPNYVNFTFLVQRGDPTEAFAAGGGPVRA